MTDARGRTRTQTFCRLCVANCGILVDVDGSRAVAIRGANDHPLSRGYTCSKGRSLAADRHQDGRLDSFTIGRGEQRRAVSATASIQAAATELRTIVERDGPDAIAIYRGNSAGFDRAGAFAAQRLAAGLGTSSLYSATTLDNIPKVAVSALMSGGASDGLVPVIDIDQARLTLLFGSNPVVSHGHDWGLPDPVRRLRQLSEQGALWVFDPRRTETAALADVHVQLRPGSDAAIVGFLIRELLADGADSEYLEAFAINADVLAQAVAPMTLDHAVAESGIDARVLSQLLEAVRSNGVVAARSGTGITMSSNPAVTEWLIWALHVVTGSFEERGGCWFQPDFFGRLEERSYQAGTAVSRPGTSARPELPGWRGERASAGLVDDIERGDITALIVVAGNPVTAFPDAERLDSALRGLDVLVALDVRTTETTEMATHVWACRSQLERADLNVGSKYSLEVHGEYAPAATPPLDGTAPMWWCFAQLGNELGLDVIPELDDLAIADDDDVLAVVASNAPVPFATLRAEPGGVVVHPEHRDWVRRKVLPNGKWDLAPAELVSELHRSIGVDAPAASGLELVVRRQPRHINSKLVGLELDRRPADASVAVGPVDAAESGVHGGGRARISSATSSIELTVEIDPTVHPGTVTVAQGFGRTNVNTLFGRNVVTDPVSGMPKLSRLRVSLEPITSSREGEQCSDR